MRFTELPNSKSCIGDLIDAGMLNRPNQFDIATDWLANCTQSNQILTLFLQRFSRRNIRCICRGGARP